VKQQEVADSPECKEPELNKLIPFFANGDVTSEQQSAIEEHLTHCQECREDLAFFVSLYELAVDAGSSSTTKAK
jgi:predicted anti-sigma-YlaC factor YlaD